MTKKSKKQLYRAQKNRVISGVIGGFGEMLKIDPVLLRAIFVLATAFTGFFPGLIAYIVLVLIVPEKK